MRVGSNRRMDGDRQTALHCTPHLSIVIPAYNEATRLPQTLATVLAYLATRPYASEVLVVDDGSTDNTAVLAEAKLAARCGRVLREPHRGKAAAVRAGMLTARGAHVLFMDADLAVPVEEIDIVLGEIGPRYAVVIGSREGTGAARIGEPILRHIMGRVNNRLVQWLAVPGINDTQCGFKLFRGDATREIFSRLKLYGPDAPEVHGARVTGFDVEVLLIARRCGYMIRECPVQWQYGEQSKVSPLRDTFYNFRDLLKVWANDRRGYYK